MVDGSWLIPDGQDRDRMRDLSRRLQPVRGASFAVLGVALLLCGPWLGWWTLVPLIVAGIVFKIADDRIEGAARPEYGVFAAWAASELIIAASVAITGGPNSPTLSWLAIPIPSLTARFSQRGIRLGVGFALALVPAVAFGVDAHTVVHDPVTVIAPMALIVAVAMLSTVLAKSDIQYRNEAVVDQLTGILNRNALRTRTVELTQQSAVTGEPVAMIVGDLDRFKAVNDTHGHTAGDAVLKDVAHLIRRELRAFDLVYRLGGEEFLVLLPGSSAEQAAFLADELRSAIASEPVGGHAIRMSFGVSASPTGSTFDFAKVFEEADAALYTAKRAGRDRVCVQGLAVAPEIRVSAARDVAPQEHEIAGR